MTDQMLHFQLINDPKFNINYNLFTMYTNLYKSIYSMIFFQSIIIYIIIERIIMKLLLSTIYTHPKSSTIKK